MENVVIEIIAGIDEVGYGAICGPMVLAGVANPFGYKNASVRDSKKFHNRRNYTAHEQRTDLSESICQNMLCHTSTVTSDVIDKIGMNASMAMAHNEIVKSLIQNVANCVQQDFILNIVFDGNGVIPAGHHGHILANTKRLAYQVQCANLVKADALVFECSAASIVAKVTHDNHMIRLSKEPGYWPYALEKNMGYGTPDHIKAINTYGITREHRRCASHTNGVTHSKVGQ